MHVLHDQLDGDLVFAAPRNYDVGMHHQRCDVMVKRGLHHARVLFQHALQVATALADVPLKSSCQSHVSVRIHEDFHVQHFEHLVVVEREDSLENDYVRSVHGFL